MVMIFTLFLTQNLELSGKLEFLILRLFFINSSLFLRIFKHFAQLILQTCHIAYQLVLSLKPNFELLTFLLFPSQRLLYRKLIIICPRKGVKYTGNIIPRILYTPLSNIFQPWPFLQLNPLLISLMALV